jgi:flagellum-specific peptidoglycan hydrolase FlgJ
MTNAEFVEKYYPMALIATRDSGIFIETLLGQSILETSSGKSLLSSKYNNFFGIKADSSWKGPSVNMKTGEVFDGKKVTINSNFRVYNSFLDSARDYVNFLKKNPRYTKAGVFKAKDYKEQIQAIKNAGYATGTNYVSAVVKIVSGITDDIAKFTSENKNKIGVGALLLLAGSIYYAYTKNLLRL